MPIAPVTYPLAAPTVSGNVLTVDMALDQPTRITRRIADLTLQRFIVDKFFTTGGSVTGGAVLYDVPIANELYTDRDVEYVAPGAEFPIVGTSRPAPAVALVEKYGGKFEVTDEARRRNDVVHFNNQVTKLSNTIVRKVNARCMAVITAAIAALGGAGTFAGHSWSTVITGGASQSPNSIWPAADLLKAQMLADVAELGVVYDLLVLNPLDAMNYGTVYGAAWRTLMKELGYDVFTSNRVTAGTAYVAAAGQVGELRLEVPLTTQSWDEPRKQSRWVQSFVNPVMFVTNPYAVIQITGIA